MWSVFMVDDAEQCAVYSSVFEHTNTSHANLSANESGSDSRSVLMQFRLAYNYVIFTLAPTNVALNLVAMSIFYKEHRRRLLYYYMFLLCCVDTLFQIFFCSTIALYIVLDVYDDVAVSKTTFAGILLVRFLAVAAQLIRNWTVAFIAAYRVSTLSLITFSVN